MADLIARQKEIIEAIQKTHSNFNKDSASRKTADYLKKRICALDSFWAEFEINHSQIFQCEEELSQTDYIEKNIYDDTKKLYEKIKGLIQNYSSERSEDETKPDPNSPPKPSIDELLCEQRTNFRALQRLINSINIEKIAEKWELEDELKNLQSRWRNIDNLHLKIDNILGGDDDIYENEFSSFELKFKDMKRRLNQKISSNIHQFESTPKVDVPVFYGDYTQWPTFLDLYKSSIHDNPTVTDAQKMQHLKGKLKGEAQRIIQHLTVSTDNYKTAWELLYHRYNNVQLLFTRHIEVFLNQRSMEKQTSSEIKRLYDTTMECIHAIHNLGVDTTTWDPIIVHLLMKKLDPDTRTDYMESRAKPRELPSFDELMTFLDGKFTALEPMSKKEKDSWQSVKQNIMHKNKEKSSFGPANKIVFHKSSYVAAANNNCIVCNKPNHSPFQCMKFEAMSPEMKVKTITKCRLCKNCLFVHEKNVCNSTKRCKICNLEHNTLLHDAYNGPKANENSTTTPKPSPRQQYANHVTSDDDEILLTTVQIRVRAADNTYMTLRALLDQGSQITLISENAAQRLGLPRHQFSASVTGVGSSIKKSKGKVHLDCSSIYNDFTFSTDALVMPKLLNCLPNVTFEGRRYPHIEHIQLADPDYNISKHVDILLDAKVYSDIIMSGLIKGSDGEPVAQLTKLGWILSGRVKTFNCNVVLNGIEDIANYWEIEEISTDTETLTEQEHFCEDLYTKTTRRLPDGRYEVRLPMKEGFEKHLGQSKARAIAQFKQLENRLSKNDKLLEKYREFMTEYRNLGHMTQCTEQKEPMCYLPHHGVIRESSTTTKLRAVFNASSKTSSGSSLNDLMECGPKLQQDIFDLLLKWRTYKYVYMADCEKMYRCILLHADQQHLQKIIWRDHPQDLLQEYQLCTVTYGMKAAPFLAMRTMQQLANDDQEKYPLAAEVLKSHFYVDDLLSGSHSIEHAREVQHQLIEMLKGAKINLRKWCSNSPDLLSSLSTEQINPSIIDFKHANSAKALGLQWNPDNDVFTFQPIDRIMKSTCTKRSLLSSISKIFDPLGWLSPLTIRAKLLFQRLWLVTMEWDDVVPDDILREWIKLQDDLQKIYQFDIPRWIGNFQASIEIHGFCDASEKAYAAVLYVKSTGDDGRKMTKMIASKTKLAPRKNTMTLPRLELCGALLLSKLIKKVTAALSLTDIPIYCWTDSLVVLGWLQGNPIRWKTFVANRTKEILDVLPSSCWRHVSSGDNAADCATRGLSTSQLLQHTLWWEGPAWLKTDIPKGVPKVDAPQVEIKTVPQSCTTLISSTIIEDLLNKHNSISYIARVIARVIRFITNIRHRMTKQQLPPIKFCSSSIVSEAPSYTTYMTANEIEHAYEIIIKNIQATELQSDIQQIKQRGSVTNKSQLLTLNPYLDDRNVLRVGGRLQNSKLTDKAKHPIILPRNSTLTELLTSQAHQQTLHGGPSLTLTYLRQRYWVLGGNRTVKKYLRNCVKCTRFNHHNPHQIMADLPQPRVTPSRPFTHTGVDFTGQVDLKANKGRGIKTTRGYIAVFVCFATKAIHLELVSDLSTPAFLAAFKRMCARRGTPKHMYSDNGTNFVGASRLLKKEYKDVLQVINTDFLNDISDLGVTWHLNAPAWPSAGGLWEAAVKSTKRHLKRVIGEQKLTFEEFTTLLTQIEACLNSRPLCALTENAEDDYLTPGHFLVGGPLLSPPMAEIDPKCIKTRWQLTEQMHRDFWRKWSSDYLQHLQTRSKWHYPTDDLKIDDIVLIKEDNMPPTKWAMGRVQSVHPGKDGHVRVATLKTKNGETKRPIIKLIRLPVHSKTYDNSPGQNDNEKPRDDVNKDKPTRNLRPRPVTSYVMTTILLLMTFMLPANASMTNIKGLNNSNSIYFDKLSDIRIIQDKWKMVVYYNMTTYWHNMRAIEKYVYSLNKTCANDDSCQPVMTQFEHELNELRHYNDLLRNKHHVGQRTKRGLINGVGYLANALFGVLDDNFARQYEHDIETLKKREDHLLTLYKNHTSILEAENNILKRNEAVMNKQFDHIYNHLKIMTNEMNRVQVEHQAALHAFHIISSLISANVIISNIRRTQDTLLDMVTDIYHGRLNVHLLSPQQLQQQLNVISGQLQGDAIVPVDNARDLYGLLQVRATVTSKFLIMEISIPLLNRDVFELSHVIDIPQNRGENKFVHTITETKYLAINVRKDTLIPMTETDVHTCRRHTQNQLLCPLNHPVYSMQVGKSLCDMQLHIDNENKPFCRAEVQHCVNDRWLKLHTRDTWLFSCCNECSIRIICAAEVMMKSLNGSGLITLDKGCVIKAESFVINAQHEYMNELYLQQELKIDMPNIPTLNDIMNVPLPGNFISETHNKTFDLIKTSIDASKNVELEKFAHVDQTHYIIIYCTLFVVTSLLLVVLYFNLKSRCNRSEEYSIRKDIEATGPTTVTAPTGGSSFSDVIITPPKAFLESPRKADESVTRSLPRIDFGTSPTHPRKIRFNLSASTSNLSR